MKALISPQEIILNGYRIAEVATNEFPIALPLYWIDCPDNCDAGTWYFNVEANECELIPIPVPTANDNKQTAANLLSSTDWTTIADVGNPAMSNPYLANPAEFIAYRNAIRNIAVYPTAGDLVWPVVPTEKWTKV